MHEKGFSETWIHSVPWFYKTIIQEFYKSRKSSWQSFYHWSFISLSILLRTNASACTDFCSWQIRLLYDATKVWTVASVIQFTVQLGGLKREEEALWLHHEFLQKNQPNKKQPQQQQKKDSTWWLKNTSVKDFNLFIYFSGRIRRQQNAWFKSFTQMLSVISEIYPVIKG